MGKVICFYTRQELTTRLISQAEGEEIIEQLLMMDVGDITDMASPPQQMIEVLITITENNSGASRYDVMEKIYNEKQA